MAIFKCKMCGGSLEINEADSIGTCEYCGTEQTLPRLDSDRKANLYDRANHFRRNNDYDKAMSIYEQILNEDNTDAEAYWSLILCRYGIEYVEDPTTHRRIPTVNRAQYTSVFADENYKSALQYASLDQKVIYEQEAKAIDEIQKGILSISEKEEPFDIFICYKETDDTGRRTQDSVLANDLYHQLTQEGFKVFFSRITLEDKLGQEYEPYIFAALNSAKAMVVLGTKPEYFNAVWVKNEWSRFLALIRSGAKKTLIPAYKDMDPYDLPEEFSHLQAQDMSKLGFMQDLIRGIKKIVGEDQEKAPIKETVVVQSGAAGNSDALLRRGNMALEDGEWGKADEFFEDVLNQDPECAEAYVGKLLAKYEESNLNDLADYYIDEYSEAKTERLPACPKAEEHISDIVKKYEFGEDLSANDIWDLYDYDISYEALLPSSKEQKENVLSDLNAERLFVRAKQYANEQLFASLDGFISKISLAMDERITKAQKDDEDSKNRVIAAYNEFISKMDERAQNRYEKAVAKADFMYKNNVEAFNTAKTIEDCERVKKNFLLSQYKDYKFYIAECDKKIDQIRRDEKEELDRIILRNQRKEKIRNVVIGVAIAGVLLFIGVLIIFKEVKYQRASSLYNDGDYITAIQIWSELKDYRNSPDKIQNSVKMICDDAVVFINGGEYEKAKDVLNQVKGCLDPEDKHTKDICKVIDGIYQMSSEESINLSNIYDKINGLPSDVDCSSFYDLEVIKQVEYLSGVWILRRAECDGERMELWERDHNAFSFECGKCIEWIDDVGIDWNLYYTDGVFSIIGPETSGEDYEIITQFDGVGDSTIIIKKVFDTYEWNYTLEKK